MLKKICVCALAIALGGAIRPSRAAENKMPTPEQMKELRELAAKDVKKQFAAREHAAELLRKVTPIVVTDKDSLSLSGEGLSMLDPRTAGAREFQCQNGLLYCATVRDYNQHYYYVAWDPSRTFAQALKEQQDALAPYFTMKSMTPDLRERIQAQVDMLRQAHSQADLEYARAVQMYSGGLIGNAALTQAQMSKLSSFYSQKQQMIDDVQKLVVAREKTPNDATMEAKVAKALQKYFDFEQHGFNQDDFYTPAQRKALGLDGANVRQHHGVVASSSASASAGGENEGDSDAAMAKAMNEQKAREKKHHDEAKVKFTLKGTDGSSGQSGINIPRGCLYVYMDALPDNSGVNYLFYLDETQSWEKRKVDWAKGYDVSKPDQKAQLDALNKSTSSNAFQWSRLVEQLRAKQTVPPEVDQHLAAMIKEWDDAALALQKSYDAVAAKPTDPALQREFFEAYRTASRVQSRNNTLADHRDMDAGLENVPWLLTTEQMDIVSADQLVTSSEMNSSTDGSSVAISARPAGDKQYVGITANNVTVGTVADKIEQAAKRYYHNHKLKLTVDAAANDKPLKGMVEGKSAEELFKSFAQRAGLNLVKDDKNPDAFTMKL